MPMKRAVFGRAEYLFLLHETGMCRLSAVPGLSPWAPGSTRSIRARLRSAVAPANCRSRTPAKQDLEYDLRPNPHAHPRVSHPAAPSAAPGRSVRPSRNSPRVAFPSANDRAGPEPRYQLKALPFCHVRRAGRPRPGAGGVVLDLQTQPAGRSGRAPGGLDALAARAHMRQPTARWRALWRPWPSPQRASAGNRGAHGLRLAELPPVRATLEAQAPSSSIGCWSAAPIDTGSDRYRCPACGGQARMTFHGDGRSGSSSATTRSLRRYKWRYNCIAYLWQ